MIGQRGNAPQFSDHGCYIFNGRGEGGTISLIITHGTGIDDKINLRSILNGSNNLIVHSHTVDCPRINLFPIDKNSRHNAVTATVQVFDATVQ